MNDKLVQKALECYIEKLEKKNEIFKDFSLQIRDAFNCRGNRNDEEIINDILNTVRTHPEVFNED